MPVKITDNSKEFFSLMDREIEDKLTQSAVIVERKAKELCPVATGTLKRSINSIIEKYRAIIGSALKYAPFVEMGTSRMRAQPYLRPALLSLKNQLNKIWNNK